MQERYGFMVTLLTVVATSFWG